MRPTLHRDTRRCIQTLHSRPPTPHHHSGDHHSLGSPARGRAAIGGAERITEANSPSSDPRSELSRRVSGVQESGSLRIIRSITACGANSLDPPGVG